MAGLQAHNDLNIPSVGSAKAANIGTLQNAGDLFGMDNRVNHDFFTLSDKLNRDYGTPDPGEDPKAGMDDVESANYDMEQVANNYYEKYLETGDSAWLEKYYETLFDIKSTYSAREWEEELSNTAFSRLIADIKNAGYNPWIALQSGYGQASVPDVSAAQGSRVSQSQQQNARTVAVINGIFKFISSFFSALGKTATKMIS